jgi:hypothetical protein
VGQDEDAQPLMRRANFCRREQARRRRVAQSPKLSQDGFKTEGDVACDVFEEDPFGAAFVDDAGDVGPEVTGIVGAAALSCLAERLALVSGKDGIERASEWPRIECSQVVPYRGRGEVSGPLGGDEDAAGVFLPLDEAAGVIAGLGKHEAHIQASAACAEGESISGT